MIRNVLPLGFVVCFALGMIMVPSSFGGLAHGFGLDVVGTHVTISQVDCTGFVSATHEFSKDGRTHYGITGSCLIRKTDQTNKIVKYYVDAHWTPNPGGRTGGHATETGRLYGLGNIDPDLFQQGNPNDPNNYTTFVIGLSCMGDPWLSDAPCTLVNFAAPEELLKIFPNIKGGPFPLSKGAIPAAQRAALQREYFKVTTGFTQKTPQILKQSPGFGRALPSQTPPYGASYGPGPISSLTPGQTTTVKVQVVNTGSLTWTPSGPNVFHLSYHWYNAGSVGAGSAPKALAVVWDGLRTNLPGPIGPNQTTLSPLNATVQAPSVAGTYVLKWDMVQEGFPVTWFSQQKVPTGDQTVVVK